MLAVAIAPNERGGEKKAHICLMQHHAGMKREGFANVNIVFGAVFYIFVMVHFWAALLSAFPWRNAPSFSNKYFFRGELLACGGLLPPSFLRSNMWHLLQTHHREKRREEEAKKASFYTNSGGIVVVGKAVSEAAVVAAEEDFSVAKKKLLREREACERSEGGAFSGGFFWAWLLVSALRNLWV